ncbi:MAG: flagellar hook assembly protein FlgD [Candidatus Hydrogenedentota bacterium]|nr:MAG: flagellar hook assembly protein FlgD [Candidatus Hydrogenedentota bacterium]
MYNTSAIESLTVAPAESGGISPVLGTSQQLDADDFLSILVTELMNQDPLDPLSDRDFISQMAQLNTLNETMELNDNILTMQMLQASALVGRTVEAIGPYGERVEGIVTEVWFIDGEPWLVIDDDLVVSLDYVVRIV